MTDTFEEDCRVCASCRFWLFEMVMHPEDRPQPYLRNECRRHAPKDGEGSDHRGRWPTTHWSEWCGEYDEHPDGAERLGNCVDAEGICDEEDEEE